MVIKSEIPIKVSNFTLFTITHYKLELRLYEDIYIVSVHGWGGEIQFCLQKIPTLFIFFIYIFTTVLGGGLEFF